MTGNAKGKVSLDLSLELPQLSDQAAFDQCIKNYVQQSPKLLRCMMLANNLDYVKLIALLKNLKLRTYAAQFFFVTLIHQGKYKKQIDVARRFLLAAMVLFGDEAIRQQLSELQVVIYDPQHGAYVLKQLKRMAASNIALLFQSRDDMFILYLLNFLVQNVFLGYPEDQIHVYTECAKVFFKNYQVESIMRCDQLNLIHYELIRLPEMSPEFIKENLVLAIFYAYHKNSCQVDQRIVDEFMTRYHDELVGLTSQTCQN